MAFDQLFFTLTDVRDIRKVSVNIDDFDMYAREVQTNYVQKILGDKLYAAMIDDLDVSGIPQTARFIDLINGVEYTNARTIIFRGIKYYACYLWLHLYMAESALSHTPIGAQVFKDEYAESARGKQDYRNARDHYIGMADGQEEPILRFLDANASTYPEFTESYRVEQAKDDNITFKVIGKRYTAPFQRFK